MTDAWQKLVNGIISMGYLKTPIIIDAFKTVDRADFVLPEYRAMAYEDRALPIGEGQTISQPLTVAFILELLQPKKGEKILDVGHGSGWQTALIAKLVGEKGTIIAVERLPALCKLGKQNLEKYNLTQKGIVKTICGDASGGIPNEAPFDKIVAAASLNGRALGRPAPGLAHRALAATKELPKEWRNELKIGGIIVAPIANSIWRFTKKSKSEWQEEEFPGFSFVPLITEEKRLVLPKRGNAPDEPAKIKIAFSFLVLTMIAGYLFYELFAPLKLEQQKTEIEIKEGAGLREIASELKNKKTIRSRWLFIGWAITGGNARNLKAGNYVFESAADIPDTINRLVRGEELPNERIITIPEGWNIDDIGIYLESQNITAKKDLFVATGAPRVLNKETELKKRLKTRFAFLNELPAGLSFEGYLFPDTYRVFKDSPAEEITEKMLDNFQRKITPEMLIEIKKQKKGLFQIITVASLIEKEVAKVEDRAIVSGILWERLEIGMGLQVDATILYIANKKAGHISPDNFLIDSPYNTYKYRGLPPGPIANPGLSTIRAAIYPKSSPYLYYLSAPDGRTIFSKTLEEHNIAKAKYLK
ncbi:MAG: endolytic transglycosylase MltG [bacterium]|nr:endolytic transglycosylase MltG [bacterium]